MIFEFSTLQLILIAMIFVWSGFVRSGLGFGGAALALPLMLLVYDKAIFWMPIIATHLLFFTALTLRTRLQQVNWVYLRKALLFIVPSTLAGVFGLINLPNDWLLLIIYGITLFYAVMWLANLAIRSQREWVDNLLLLIGGYVAGTSLTGAPLMFAVFMRNVAIPQLRNTLFVVWFTICALKLSAFTAFKVDLNLMTAAMLLPITAIGHVIGLRTHDYIMQNDQLFKRVIGGVLVFICLYGLWRVLL